MNWPAAKKLTEYWPENENKARIVNLRNLLLGIFSMFTATGKKEDSSSTDSKEKGKDPKN